MRTPPQNLSAPLLGRIAATATIQGGVQALLGGSFRDGALAGLASGLATAAGGALDAKIAEAASTMTAAELMAAKTFSRMFTSAIRAAGSPGDAAQAFASAFLNEVVGPPPGPSAPSAPAAPVTPDAAQAALLTDTSAPRSIADLWNETYGAGSQTVGWTTREGGNFATQSTGATADLSAMRRAPELDAGFGYPRPAGGSVQAYVQADGAVGYLVSQGGRSEFFDPARYGVAAQTDGSYDAAELRRFTNHPSIAEGVMPLVELERVVVVGQRADVAAAARASLLAGAAAGEVWTLESLTTLGSRALGGLPSLGELAAAIPELGLRTLGAGAALLLAPANAGQRGVVPLNDFQRFEARPGELYGSLQALDDDAQWRTVKTGVQLVQLGSQRLALTDEELQRLQAPLINVPPEEAPTALPPLPDWATQQELPLPGFAAQALAGPTVTTTPIAEPHWQDLLIEKRDREILAGNLERLDGPRPAGHEAHHIVPTLAGDARMAALRQLLRDLGIGLNDAANGVWLPGRNAPVDAVGAYHPRLDNKVYNDALLEALDGVGSQQAALAALRDIKAQLQASDFPGVRPRPPAKGKEP